MLNGFLIVFAAALVGYVALWLGGVKVPGTGDESFHSAGYFAAPEDPREDAS